MKYRIKIVAISFLATILSIIIFKNFFIEYFFKNKLYNSGISLQSIKCEGFYNINCKLNNISVVYINNLTKFNINIKEVKLDNILSIYNIYKSKKIDNNQFTINFIKAYVTDDKKVLHSLSYPILIKVENKNHHFKSTFNIGENNFSISQYKIKKNIYILNMHLNHKNIENILYELYKLKFLETLQVDGKEIAKGINISFGFSSSKVIPKKDFIKKSMPRFIDMFSSEIESYDIFNTYNKNNQLYKILDTVLNRDGNYTFYIDINLKEVK